MIKLDNQHKGLCIVCDAKIDDSGMVKCRQCGKRCEIDPATVGKEVTFYNVKSLCCKADVDMGVRTTCGAACHDVLIREMEQQFGKFKKVADTTTGKSYMVPLKYIIEYGLDVSELPKFPEWRKNSDV